jgi:hypothetical protein
MISVKKRLHLQIQAQPIEQRSCQTLKLKQGLDLIDYFKKSNEEEVSRGDRSKPLSSTMVDPVNHG